MNIAIIFSFNNAHPDHSALSEIMNIPVIDVTVEALGLDAPEYGDPDVEWLAQWSQLIDMAPPTIHVPPRARGITTPLNFAAWRHLLMAHPDRDLVHFFLQGITRGFRTGYSPLLSELKSSKRNMNSTRDHTKNSR